MQLHRPRRNRENGRPGELIVPQWTPTAAPSGSGNARRRTRRRKGPRRCPRLPPMLSRASARGLHCCNGPRCRSAQQSGVVAAAMPAGTADIVPAPHVAENTRTSKQPHRGWRNPSTSVRDSTGSWATKRYGADATFACRDPSSRSRFRRPGAWPYVGEVTRFLSPPLAAGWAVTCEP